MAGFILVGSFVFILASLMFPIINTSRNRINWIRSSIAIILIISFTYIIGGNVLEKYFNLLFRDWILQFVTMILAICFLIIEILILIKLNSVLEKRWSTKRILKTIIPILYVVLIILVDFYAFFMYIFTIGVRYEEVGVETYKGEKYLVRDINGWTERDYIYNYHVYKNIFVYDADIKYSETEIDDEKESDPIPIIIDEGIDNTTKDEVIEIIPDNVEYIQNIDGNLNYGFYLIDRAGHQYSYAFVQSNDDGLSWEIVYQFPANSEIYYGNFLDKELGFINFGSSDGLSLLMTNDGGLTWKDVLINLPEENRNMIYVQEIKKSGEEIELILGVPSWSNSNQSIKYISVDKGLSWELQI